MWRLLRLCFPEARFRRQVPLVRYVVDFASHRERLVIEVDGGQHCAERDAERTRLILAEGYRVLRFWNNDVLSNPDGVATMIEAALARSDDAGADSESTPTLPSPIKGEGS